MDADVAMLSVQLPQIFDASVYADHRDADKIGRIHVEVLYGPGSAEGRFGSGPEE